MNHRIKEDSIFGLINRENQRQKNHIELIACLLYTSPSPRDRTRSRMPSSA